MDGQPLPPPPPVFVHKPSQNIPLGWTEHVSSANFLFWFNISSGESTYERPPALTGPPKGATIDPKSGKLVIPERKKERPHSKFPVEGFPSWIRIVTTYENTFYYNKRTKTSTWDMPEEIAKVENSRIQEETRQLAIERAADEKLAEEARAAQAELQAQEAATKAARKPKNKKAKVIQSLADIEDAELKESLTQELAEEEARLNDAERLAESATRASKTATVSQIPDSELTSEESVSQFKAMLEEKSINPMAPWDMELPKFADDSRYLLVKQLKDRKTYFDEFCKAKIQSQRNKGAKKAALPGDSAAEYRSLLEKEVTSTRTHWDDFRQKFRKDSRFKDFGKDDREREKTFKAWLRELGEVKRAEAQQAESDFIDLLYEKEVWASENWSDVKNKLSKYPAYGAVKSSSLREEIFKKYLKDVQPDDSEAQKISDRKAKQERAIASLAQRQEQVQKEQNRASRQIERSRAEAGAEEAAREFTSLLIDAVRAHDTRWADVERSLSNDSRFHLPGLTPALRQRLWEEHITKLSSRRQGSLEQLFEQHASSLDTPFSEVYSKIQDEFSVKRLGKSESEVADLYAAWMRKQRTAAYDDLMTLLGESSFVDFWGRMRKEKEGKESDKDAGFGNAEEGVEQSADGSDLKLLSKQIDLREISSVLKHDKRYQALSSTPEQRDNWIRDYLDRLSAPKMTVFQKS